MKKFLFPLFVVFFLLLSPRLVSSHGSGPPFLKINGTFIQANPYYQGGAVTLPVAQDLPLENYLVNTPINFEIDKSQLLFSPDIIDDITFRWSFKEKDTAYQYGDKIVHTYDKVGSYLVSIEAQIPNDPYILINTVQVNVVPTKAYRLPSMSLAVGSDLKSSGPIVAVSTPITDASSKITKSLWDTGQGNGKLYEGSTICFSAGDSYFTEVYHRIVDSNGLYTDGGFSLTAIDGKIQFNAAGYGTKPPMVKPYNEFISFKDRLFGPCSTMQPYLLVGIALFLLVGVAIFVLFTKKKGPPKVGHSSSSA